MLFLDTETIGLTGPIVLIQYATERGPVEVHEVWSESVGKTLLLLEDLAGTEVCAFNLAFDWFQLSKLYDVLRRLLDHSSRPDPIKVAELECDSSQAYALKPKAALDLMLHARKGPYQATMARDDLRLKRVPRLLAEPLIHELERRIRLPDIYFHRGTGERWRTYELDPVEADFVDVALKFSASTSLDALAHDALGARKLDFPIPKELYPKDLELEYRPFAGAWPRVWGRHVAFWRRPEALAYARRDVELLRDLWVKLGRPSPGDDDSELAACVGTCRWRGWALDRERLYAARETATWAKGIAPRAPNAVRAYLEEPMSDLEKATLVSTRKDVLHVLARGEGEVAQRAERVIQARTAEKKANLCEKLLEAGRAHFDFKVIGTLSGRMAGAGGINPQGIDATLRSAFPLADGDVPVLSGGDFSSFEVSLAAAAYDDPQLTEDLRTGKKIHALFGSALYAKAYEEILGTKGSGAEGDLYLRSKTGFFSLLYGATEDKLADVTNLEVGAAAKALERFFERYPQVKVARQRVFDAFCSMRQPGGLGTAVEWHDPADHVESLLGFKRYYTLENALCRALFELASDPPRGLRAFSHERVRRRARAQTPGGAARSALYAAAFNVQARNMRSAANHVIQATGAQITKDLQRRIWDLQPVGAHPFEVQPFNVHDEVQVAHRAGLEGALRGVVEDVLERYRPTVPLIAMDFQTGMKTWAEK